MRALLLAPAEDVGLHLRLFMLFWLTLGHFWFSVVTSETFSSNLRKALKKNIESVSMLIPPSDLPPSPPTVSALGFFLCDFFGLLVLFGML